jgi:hypothetical protein
LIIEQALMKAVKEEEKRQRELAVSRRNYAQLQEDQETPAQEVLQRNNQPGRGEVTDEAGSNMGAPQYQEPAKRNDMEPEPLPCEYFDFIFGTSTGGYEILTKD